MAGGDAPPGTLATAAASPCPAAVEKGGFPCLLLPLVQSRSNFHSAAQNPSRRHQIWRGSRSSTSAGPSLAPWRPAAAALSRSRRRRCRGGARKEPDLLDRLDLRRRVPCSLATRNGRARPKPALLEGRDRDAMVSRQCEGEEMPHQCRRKDGEPAGKGGHEKRGGERTRGGGTAIQDRSGGAS